MLSVTNASGYNRIDQFVFVSTESEDVEEDEVDAEDGGDEVDESLYATIRLRIFSVKNKPVEKAVVFIRQKGKKLSLINLSTNKTVKKLTSNKKGRIPKFLITKELSEGEAVTLCVRKKKVKECADFSPETDVVTTLEFTFENKTVK